MTPKWRKIIDISGPSPNPRHGHRAVAIKELIVIFGGGNEGIMDHLHVFNTEKNCWFMPAVKGNIPRGRAAYGIAIDKTRIIIYGGMMEFGMPTNEIYELQASRWEWQELKVRSLQDKPPPIPRLGHSFTLIKNLIYMFGGLAMDSDMPGSSLTYPRYLNELYTLELCQDGSVAWGVPPVFGKSPLGRESHSAVAHCTDGGYKIFIFGGMNTCRLGDLWMFDIRSMTWNEIQAGGPRPFPRSLHSATVVDNKMYVFGGWIPFYEDDYEIKRKEWKVTNQLASLDLVSLKWKIYFPNTPEEIPKARAGHCAVALNDRIYIWSGRDGYRKAWKSQVCFNDMWYLEIKPPSPVSKPLLAKGETQNLELIWNTVQSADCYLLQIQRYVPPSSIKTTSFSTILESQSSHSDSDNAVVTSTTTDHQNSPIDHNPALTHPKPSPTNPPPPKTQIICQKPCSQVRPPVLIRTPPGFTLTSQNSNTIQNMNKFSLMRPGLPVLFRLTNSKDASGLKAVRLYNNNSITAKHATLLKLVSIKNENQIKLVSTNNSSKGIENNNNLDQTKCMPVHPHSENINTRLQGASNNIQRHLHSEESVGSCGQFSPSYTSDVSSVNLDMDTNDDDLGSNQETKPAPIYTQLQTTTTSFPSSTIESENSCLENSERLKMNPEVSSSMSGINPRNSNQLNRPTTVCSRKNGNNGMHKLVRIKKLEIPSANKSQTNPRLRPEVPPLKRPKISSLKRLEMPSSPMYIQIKRVEPSGGARISWVPPSKGIIIHHYTVVLVVRRDVDPSRRKIVYEGPQPEFSISKSGLDEAEIEKSGKESIVSFYISATNSYGTSEPLLFRWTILPALTASSSNV